MKKEFIDAINNGEIVKIQDFDTNKGAYRLIIVVSDGNVYLYKYLDGEMVECCNLSKLNGRKIQ